MVHTLDITSSDGQVAWGGYNPGDLLRRRGAASFVSSGTSGEAEMNIVGGLVDDYVCCELS